MMHSSVLDFLSRKAKTQSIMQFASALCAGRPSNHVVCLSPHVHQVREGKARYYWVQWILQRTILHCCLMTQNVRAVCFHVTKKGKNTAHTSQTLNSEALANLQAHGEMRNESEWGWLSSTTSHCIPPPTSPCSECAHECDSSSDSTRGT